MNTFFVYGAPGTGKTTLACTAPTPILILDVDGKASSMHNISHLIADGRVTVRTLDVPLSSGTLRNKLLTIKSPQVSMPMGLLKLADIITELEGKCEYKTVVLDSLTLTNEHIKRYLLFATKKVQLSYEGWAFVQDTYINLFESLQKIAVENIIIIAHERIDKDTKVDASTKFVIRPLIESSMKDKFGIFFNEIYYCFVTDTDGNTKWKVRTSPNEDIIARTSLNLDTIEEPNISQILIKGKLSKVNKTVSKKVT